jgi:hypothetical protein
MKQTAVDFLIYHIRQDTFVHSKSTKEWNEVFQQSKEMEKEQMVDFAFKYGDLTTREIADSFDKEYKTNE